MIVLGNVANQEVMNREYRVKTLDNMDLPLAVSADSEGRVWLIVGTDSGFEGLSAFYYTRVSYTLSAVNPPAMPPVTGDSTPALWMMALIAGIGAVMVGVGVMALRRP